MIPEIFFDDVVLPASFEGDNPFVFNASNLRLRANEFSLKGIKIELGTKSYDPSPDLIDWLIFKTHDPELRLFGLILMSSVFNEGQIIIDLDDPKGHIDKIIIDRTETTQAFSRLKLIPMEYEYSPNRCEDPFPFSGNEPTSPVSLNVVFRSSPFCLPRERYDERKTLYITGNAEAMATIAVFFLNVGIPEQGHTEFNLERPVGFSGVSHLSAEVRLYTEKSEFFD